MLSIWLTAGHRRDPIDDEILDNKADEEVIRSFKASAERVADKGRRLSSLPNRIIPIQAAVSIPAEHYLQSSVGLLSAASHPHPVLVSALSPQCHRTRRVLPILGRVLQLRGRRSPHEPDLDSGWTSRYGLTGRQLLQL